VQRRLLHCGALVATPGDLAPLDHKPEDWTSALERFIDQMDNTLPPISSFILPGGGLAAAQLHVCRSTCRRAERTVVDLLQRDEAKYGTAPHKAAIFLNRLSDFFFVAARRASLPDQEKPWDKHSS
jgi:cob(I)alamin adenosyltransferase